MATAPEIGVGFRSLHTYGGNEIPHPEHFVRKSLVNQCAVCERRKLAVRVRFAQTDDVRFPHKRLTAGVQKEVTAEVIGLTNDGIHLVVTQIQSVAIFRRPTAGAFQIARRGRVDQQRRLFPLFLSLF
jgi:hypothetical protein